MNIVITAGGTSEYIDSVRKITNSSSGRLGSIIANVLSKRSDIVKIFYICSKKSIKPNLNEKIEIIEIVNTLELKEVVEKILEENQIDYFIHSMAVSDYIVDFVTTPAMLKDEIEDNGGKIEDIVNNENILDNTTKISSDMDNLIVMLKKAPKIIKIIKKISPKTKLIGFKLLNNVSYDELISVAKKLRDKNNCDYVVANDLSKIDSSHHVAHIIDNNNNIINAHTKKDIAYKLSKIII